MYNDTPTRTSSSVMSHTRPSRLLNPSPSTSPVPPSHVSSTERVTCFSAPRSPLTTSLTTPLLRSSVGRAVVEPSTAHFLGASSISPTSEWHTVRLFSPLLSPHSTPPPPRQLEPLEGVMARKYQTRGDTEVNSGFSRTTVNGLSHDASFSAYLPPSASTSASKAEDSFNSSWDRRPLPLPQMSASMMANLSPATTTTKATTKATTGAPHSASSAPCPPALPPPSSAAAGVSLLLSPNQLTSLPASFGALAKGAATSTTTACTCEQDAKRCSGPLLVPHAPVGTSTRPRHTHPRSEDLLDLTSPYRDVASPIDSLTDEPSGCPKTPRDGNGGPQNALLHAVRALQHHLDDPAMVLADSALCSPPGFCSDARSPTSTAGESTVLADEERRALLSMCRLLERRIARHVSSPTRTPVSMAAVAKHSGSDSSVGHESVGLTTNATQLTARSSAVATRFSSSVPTCSLLSPYAPSRSSVNADPLAGSAFSREDDRALTPSHDLTSPTSVVLAESTASFGRGYSHSVTEALTDSDLAASRVHRAAGRILILLETWQYISANCYDRFADALFSELLRASPEYAALFFGKDVTQQALAVMAMMGRAVVAMSEPNHMMDLMHELGARHRLHGIGEPHYKAMQEAFFVCLHDFVPADQVARSEPAWVNFWSTMISLMLAGARSDRGEYYEVQRKVQWVEEVQKIMRALAPLEAGESGGIRQHTFALAMYNMAIADRPELSVFSNMATVRTGDRLMGSVYFIVEHLSDVDQSSLEEYISLVSARHEEYGVTAEALKDFANYYVNTVKQFLKKLPAEQYEKVWSRLSRRRLLSFWQFLVERWADSFARKDERTALLRGLGLDGSQAITFIFTDIEQSTSLWEKNRAVMAAAVRQHHAIIRSLIADMGAFEVKTVGDSFMIACANPAVALKLAVGIQLELMRNAIVPGFSMCEGVVGDGRAACWRDDSLRVRVGIHTGAEATPVYDAVHNRYDYYGPVVNCAARVESAAAGGQILMTCDCLAMLASLESFTVQPVPWQLRTCENVDTPGNHGSPSELRRRSTFASNRPFKDFVSFYESSDLQLRGISHPVKVVSVLPRALAGRRFPNQGRNVTLDELVSPFEKEPAPPQDEQVEA